MPPLLIRRLGSIVALGLGVAASAAMQAPPSPPLSGETPPGINIALAALGGHVESATTEANQTTFAAKNLIDGFPFVTDGSFCRGSCGWSSTAASPQELVFSFRDHREALIAAVVIDPTTEDTSGRYSDRIPKDVEVWVSTKSATDGFTMLAHATLARTATPQTIPLPATTARFVKLRLVSSFGTWRMQLGEVEIVEDLSRASITAGAQYNIALPELGGAVVRYTSQYSIDEGVHALVDGHTDQKGWRSRDATLPQDIVFGFRGGLDAAIDHIVLSPSPAPSDPRARPKRVLVAVSDTLADGAFVDVGECGLASDGGGRTCPVGRSARYLRLRIVENNGALFTSLGEVQVLEGSAPGYTSVMSRRPTASAASDVSTVDAHGAMPEREPNNAPATAMAMPLGSPVAGRIDSPDDQDYFGLTVSPAPAPVLTVDLSARPNLRMALSIEDAAGRVESRFDPSKQGGRSVSLSWKVSPGPHLLHVSPVPPAIVLVWDTSGSMEGRSDDERRAVEGFIDRIQPRDRVNLIRFSNDVEVLLKDFSSDPEQLKAATALKFKPSGGTRLYDAIAKAVELLAPLGGSRAIVAITDGADSGSRTLAPEYWRLLANQSICLYYVGLGADMRAFLPALGTTSGRSMQEVATAASGRFFAVNQSDQLPGVFQEISDEIRSATSYTLRATVSSGTGLVNVASTGERITGVSSPSRLELVVDASGSMKRRIHGKTMIELAKETTSAIVRDLPDDVQVGLRVYGHRIAEGRPNACKDSELVVPFSKIDRPRLLTAIGRIQALGTTPIAYSLEQVGLDLSRDPASEKFVVLVTDGQEECGGNPRAALDALKAKGLKVRLNVVGFALSAEAARKQMQDLATVGGGSFFNASDGDALRAGVQASLAVPFDLDDAGGTVVATGRVGGASVEAPEGVYTVVVHADQEIRISDVRIEHGQTKRIELRREGREIGIAR